MERHQYPPPRTQFGSGHHPPPPHPSHDDSRSSKRMRIGSPPFSGDSRYSHAQSQQQHHHHQQQQQQQHTRYPDRNSSLSPPGDSRGMAYRTSSQQQQQHLPPLSQHHSQREDPHQSLYRGPTSTPPLSDRAPPGMPRDSHPQSGAHYRASPPNAPPYGNNHQHHHQPPPHQQHQQHQAPPPPPQHHQSHHHLHQQQHQHSQHQQQPPPPPPPPSDRNKGHGWYDNPDHRQQQQQQQHHYPSMHHQEQPSHHQREPPPPQHQQQQQQHHPQYPPPHSQHQYPSPYQPGPPHNSSSHLQSTHNQLQRQLRQDDRTPPPSHHHQPPPPPQQTHHRSPSDHHIDHHRSSSYQENRYSTPPLLSASMNRGMPPPPSTSPHPPGPGSRAPPPQFPPPTSGSSYQGGGRDLPSLSSLGSLPRMSLSSILGNDTPPARSRAEQPPPPPPLQHRESMPPRAVQPEYSPLKRPYTPDYPHSAPPNERVREVSGDSRSPSGGASSLPPIGKQPLNTTPPSSHRSGPSPRLQPSPIPARPMSQPSAPREQQHLPQAMDIDRVKEEPVSRQPHRARDDQQPPQKEPQHPRESLSQQASPTGPRQDAPAASTASQQQSSSPAYHHLPASTITAPAVPLSAYTTTMPASPFAITPALPTSASLPIPPQFESSAADKRRQERDRSRERDVTPLRAEEALGQRVHERKAAAAAGQGSPMRGVMEGGGKLSSPRPERKGDDYGAKKEPDESDGLVNGVKAESGAEKAAASKRRKHHAPGHHHHHHSSHTSHAPHHHHHHHSKSDLGDDLLQGPPLTASPAPQSLGPLINSATTLPPKMVINNAPLLEAMKTFPSSHLGSASYTPVVLDPQTHSVKEQFMIPHFVERENCTFDVRIAARYLGIAERNKVCKKRMLWGSGVYTDDSNIIAVLIHEGHIPVVHGGTEYSDYADEHDAALAKIALGKKSGRAKKDPVVASLLAENGIPQPAQAIQKDKDLQVKLRIAPTLAKYGSSVRYGLKSRSWDKHDGMSFVIDEVKWVHKGAAEARGSLGKRKRIPNLEMAKQACYNTKEGELEIQERPGATWLALSRKPAPKQVTEAGPVLPNGIDTAQFPHKAPEVMAAG